MTLQFSTDRLVTYQHVFFSLGMVQALICIGQPTRLLHEKKCDIKIKAIS